MIQIGKYNTLEIVKEVDFGLYLSDKERSQEILLPLKYVPEVHDIGQTLSVFVYHDSEGRIICTTLHPYAIVGEFAYLKVIEITAFGAFVDWGIAKDLLVPNKEQRTSMQVGKEYIVYIYRDQETGRVAASSKWGNFIEKEEVEVEEGEPVDVLIAEQTDLGYKAIINDIHEGLIYKNEVFEPIAIGERRKAYIKKIREGNKIDLSLQVQGYEHIVDAKEKLITLLTLKGGILPIGDKSSPEEIYDTVKLSKKAFKKAIGGLYKDRKIEITDFEVKLLH